MEFKQQTQCAFLCQKNYKSDDKDHQEKLRLLQRGMKLNYQHHWIIDNMPVTFCFINQQNMNVCTTGFPMGCYVTKEGKPKDACVLDVSHFFLLIPKTTYFVEPLSRR